ncbi:molecular chaperone [Salmonella enterica]|nr:molecular chaperone [Salmonella enterica subsp. diarizonae]
MFKSGKMCSCFALILFSALSAHESDGAQHYGITLGTSRVIYPLNGKGVAINITNPQDYPVLVKTVVLDEQHKNEAPFYVTPPLFRLDGGQMNAMSIIRTGGHYPSDRESINWLCAQGIPPGTDSVWADSDGKEGSSGAGKVSMNMQVIVGSCIKMIIRPESINGNPVDMADKISWRIAGKSITARNPTPFYMNIKSISFNGAKVNMTRSYIPPFSEENMPLPSGHYVKGSLEWEIIGDHGEKYKKVTALN